MKLSPFITLIFVALLSTPAMAQAPATSSASHPVAIVLLSVIGLLAFVILLLAKVMLSAYPIYKKKIANASKKAAPVIILFLLLISQHTLAQDAATTETTTTQAGTWITGLSNTAFLFMISIIVLELIIIFYMASVFRSFIKLQKPETVTVKKKKFAWFEKLNNTKTVDADSESKYSLGHNYDGIEELDNPTPPWWQWGFVLSGIFAVVYLWVYFVSHSAPNQFQELEIANKKAEEQIKAYMATSANNIDEKTVTYLDDAADIGEGKKIFTSVCAACHGADGGGLVGPNLTDKYWLHGGTINDIFKTIKYGVPEKGMKSWKDDYTPKQIAQLASYIMSIKGTKPANPKEPQGDAVE